MIQENISLKDLTTFHIGGPARYFVVVTSTEELKEAVAFAKEKLLQIFILGGGSNILVSDQGFPGLVIKIEIQGIETREVDGNKVEVIAGAGEDWDQFVGKMVEHGLYGIENLSLIPGSVGAAPVQNIGAYGVEAKDSISWVEVLNIETGEVEKLSNAQCAFAYRDSIFKTPEGKKYIITRVAFSLSREGKLSTEYKDVAEYIKNNNVVEINLQKIRDIVIAIRTAKLPDVRHVGTAGSFFKNPIIAEIQFNELKKQYPDLPGFTTASHPSFSKEGQGDGVSIKIPAAWLLDKLCGFKGYRVGNVGVYKTQALVLVNFNGATANEIFSLSEKMIACVKEKTNIILEREVHIIGEII
ncbi:MAG: UDP-N-acetylmuramate dehydrogenase [bacterium]|nr:UDP-N-acetylmuramate dehydrogenase [bacterium]